MLGGSYGEFIKNLFLTPLEIHLSYLDDSMSGLGITNDVNFFNYLYMTTVILLAYIIANLMGNIY